MISMLDKQGHCTLGECLRVHPMNTLPILCGTISEQWSAFTLWVENGGGDHLLVSAQANYTA
jgi:hypothetical protein